ncbi:nucleopolyhedrovirus P10 family protein [Streptomyces sp. NPDC005925]|uniref:nucleopolyhedrovirus P10 family protein n=1 Tax=Streptomyces sp. NPDC005925 TaxID=3157172 RepID=UPI0034020475
MTADRWTRTVRQQVGLGRLLPLGGPHDGAWLAEAAAGAVLRDAARNVPGVRPGRVRIALADPEDTTDPVVPPPPGALPPGPLRVTADFAATATEPLPETASRLRTALSTAATHRLGLRVTKVDLRVTDLWESQDAAGSEAPADATDGGHPPADVRDSDSGDAGRVARAVLAVPGVAGLTGVPARRPVGFWEAATDGDPALPRRHVQVQIAVRADHRALHVAREVRARTGELLPDRPTVTVLVTAVE